MSLFDISEATYSTYSFFAIPKNISEIAKLLRSMSFSEKVNIYIDGFGMKMTVEEAKCVQVIVYLKKEHFQIYHLKDDEELYLKISLKEMLDCLKKMSPDGSKTSAKSLIDLSAVRMHFIIKNQASDFQMMLLEDNVEIHFEMQSEQYDDLMEIIVDPVAVKIIMNAQEVWEYFKVLEDIIPEFIGFNVENEEKQLSISANCPEGAVEVIVPVTSTVVESFECAQNIKSVYKMSNIKHAIRIMPLSCKCAFKQDSNGVLQFDFLIEGEDDNIVEYYCVPQGSEDDQDAMFQSQNNGCWEHSTATATKG